MRRRFSIFVLLAFGGVGPPPVHPVVAVDIVGVVHPITVEIIERALTQANQQNAAAVLIRINTAGGMPDAARQIVEKILASPVPVVTYVTPNTAGAASAGFVVLEAGDVAAMASGTHAGAAHPFVIPQMDPVIRKKLENDAAASLRAVVTKRGRNIALAEKAVFESQSFTDQEALENKLIDLTAADEKELLGKLEGREVVRFDGRRQVLHLAGAKIIEYEKTIRENLLARITDPNLALMLVILGALGIYAEFASPGLIFPGVAGAILALLGLTAIAVLPINWIGAALMILAVVLFVLEAKITSHGILGTGGAVAMILGAMLLVDSPVPEMRIRPAVAISIGLPFAIITMALTALVVRARRNKVVTGSEGMIGEIGVTAEPLSPGGKVFVHGEYWDAVATTVVPDGVPVKVTGMKRMTLIVEPVPKETGG
jgi:membrane-bound serine protease (ClpP class)